MTFIDAHSIDWSAQLDQIHNSKSQVCDTYLLVDGVFNAHWYDYLKATPRTEWRALFEGMPSANEKALQASPLLVRYAPNDHKQEQLLQATSGRPMLSALTTPEGIDFLATRLAPWCVVEADKQRFNFRFTDTRRLPGIVAVMTARQHGQFLGSACAAYYVDRKGSWEPLPLPKQPEPPAEQVKLSDEQFAALVSDSEADEMLAALTYPFPNGYEQLAPSARHARARGALNQALRYNVIELAGRMSLCRLVLEFPQWESDAKSLQLAQSMPAEDDDRWESIATLCRNDEQK